MPFTAKQLPTVADPINFSFCSHTRQQYTITLTTFPMAPDESEQMDGTAQEDNDSNNPEHSSERTEMVPSSCVTPTG